MPSSIRSRLLLLVVSVLVPAVAAAAWTVAAAYAAERQAVERNLREATRALSLLVDRELTRRATTARVLADVAELDDGAPLRPAQLRAFEQQARRALQGMAGWVELSTPQLLLVDTRRAGAAEPTPRHGGPLLNAATVGALTAESGTLHAAIVQPVRRGSRTLYNVAVTLLPSELQKLLEEQRPLPQGWVGAVVDPRGTVVAQFPADGASAGAPLPQALRDAVAAGAEGHFEARFGGSEIEGYYGTSRDGWRFVTAMPRRDDAGALPRAVVELALASALLLGAAVASALTVARSIVRPVNSLKDAAARLQAGLPVQHRATGIAECDGVAMALAEAAEAMRHRRADLERQVGEAVAQARASEQRLSRSQRVEALGRLTGGVAHDFNNLLGVISNSAHVIQRRAAAADVQSPLAALLRAVEAGSRLTRHLLRFAGRSPVRPGAVVLARELPEVVELMKVVLGKRIEVALHVAEGTPPIHADANELELALINLAQNSRDALPNGGHVWIDARPAAAADTADLAPRSYVAITVSDDGVGVDEAIVDRVFEPFFTTKDGDRGAGLGLSQVHGFCAQAGGRARLASTPGVGTSVTLLLPAHRAESAADGGTSAAAPAAPPDERLAGRRLLLVEDNDELAGVTAVLLGSYGCRVDVARGPAEALQNIERGERYDVVLSDVVMPGEMDGVRLAHHLRRHVPELPVVLISGYSSALASVQDFIVLHKPCSPEQLVGALSQALAGGAATAQQSPSAS